MLEAEYFFIAEINGS